MAEDFKDADALKRCFVVCPIGAAGSSTRTHADWLLHELIEHVFDRHFPGKFTVHRSDKIDQPGMIDAQIIDHLLEDELVIADMSELNPNAFYEMGIRHMKELPIIHMFKKGTDIPFDVKLYRAIPFAFDHPDDLRTARNDLKKAVDAVLAKDYKPDNPVIRARGVVKLNESEAPEATVMRTMIEELAEKVRRLEAGVDGTNGISLGKNLVTVEFPAPIKTQTARELWAQLSNFFDTRIMRVSVTTTRMQFILDMPEDEDFDDISSLARRIGLDNLRFRSQVV